VDGYDGPGALFTTNVLLDRRDESWLSHLAGGGVGRYYLYPVHLSGLFLFTPTLASSLCLLLMRFMARDYPSVAKAALSCVSDTPLSSEEQQLWDQLEFLQDDCSPDASVGVPFCSHLLPLSLAVLRAVRSRCHFLVLFGRSRSRATGVGY
jgi:hypothetical protein